MTDHKDIAAIMGLTPYRTRDDVLRERVREHHGAPSEFETNPAIEYGKNMLDGARFDYELEMGLVDDSVMLHIKCPYNLRDVPKPVPFNTIHNQPAEYARIQFLMAGTNIRSCDFYQWSPTDYRLERVEFSPLYYTKEIQTAFSAFLVDYENAIANPDEHLEPLRVELNTAHTSKLIAEYDDLLDAIDQATERKKDVLAELIKLSGEKNALIHGRKLTHVERKGSVSYAKAFRALLPKADFEPYRGKPSASWRLT